MKKWIGVIVLVIVGIVAAIVAIEYLTQSIHQLPSILGGKHVRGHYHKRGYAAVVVAILALGGAALLAVRITRSDSAGGTPVNPGVGATTVPVGDSASANSLLGGAAAPEASRES